MDCKHLGRNTTTGSRVIVILPQIIGREDSALVVEIDSVAPKYRDKLIDIAISKRAQSSHTDFYNLLNTNVFPTGGLVLATLHNEGLLIPTPIRSIEMTPTDNEVVKLSTIVGLSDEPTQEDQSPKPIAEPTAQDASPEALLKTANDLKAYAKKLTDLAYLLNPDLKPAKRTAKK